MWRDYKITLKLSTEYTKRISQISSLSKQREDFINYISIKGLIEQRWWCFFTSASVKRTYDICTLSQFIRNPRFCVYDCCFKSMLFSYDCSISLAFKSGWIWYFIASYASFCWKKRDGKDANWSWVIAVSVQEAGKDLGMTEHITFIYAESCRYSLLMNELMILCVKSLLH